MLTLLENLTIHVTENCVIVNHFVKPAPDHDFYIINCMDPAAALRVHDAILNLAKVGLDGKDLGDLLSFLCRRLLDPNRVNAELGKITNEIDALLAL